LDAVDGERWDRRRVPRPGFGLVWRDLDRRVVGAERIGSLAISHSPAFMPRPGFDLVWRAAGILITMLGRSATYRRGVTFYVWADGIYRRR
jgi:hypothetical protein